MKDLGVDPTRFTNMESHWCAIADAEAATAAKMAEVVTHLFGVEELCTEFASHLKVPVEAI